MDRVGGTRATLCRPRLRRAVPWCAFIGATSPVWAIAPQAPALAAGTAEAAGSITLTTAVFTLAVAALALVIGVMLALRIARAQRRLADELHEARSRAQCLDGLLDVWQWQSDAQHRIVWLRPPHGAPASDWSAARPPALVWEQFNPADAAALRARLEREAPLDDIEVRRDAPTGEPRSGLLRGRMFTDATGRFAGYRGTWRDLSTAVVAVSGTAPVQPLSIGSLSQPGGLLAAATAESDHESFSFTVSHDLRAPIRVVEGFTRIVKEDYGRLLDRVGNDHLDRVLGASARMNNMIDALLALSNLSSQPLARQPVNLSQLAGYVADDLRRQWPEREVQIEVEPGMQVQGDPTLLRVVIENLLGNAWKYTGKSPQASIAFVRNPQEADAFTVRDNGAGFDMRFADRLFGVFQRLHSANDFPGTGVGLASVRRIVRRHGGEIWGEAEVSRGARFHFSLPQGDERR